MPGRCRRSGGLRCLAVLVQGLGQPGRRRPGPLIPGTCGQDLAHEGGPPAKESRPGWRYRPAERAARWADVPGGGSTVPAASVPATTTVWCSRAETIWPAQVVWRLHPCFLSLASILALPARFRSAGVGQAATGLPGGVVRPARAPAPARGWGGSGCTGPGSGWRSG